MAAQGGWRPLTKQSKNNYNKRRHLVQRFRLLMDAKPHGLSTDAACRVYQHVKQQGDFSIAELRDAVNHAGQSLIAEPEEDWQLAAKTWA